MKKGLIDFQPLLDKVNGKVHFTTLSESFSKKSLFDIVLSSLQVSETQYIEVLWDSNLKQFVITLFVDPLTIDTLDDILQQEICNDVKEVYSIVKRMVEVL